MCFLMILVDGTCCYTLIGTCAGLLNLHAEPTVTVLYVSERDKAADSVETRICYFKVNISKFPSYLPEWSMSQK